MHGLPRDIDELLRLYEATIRAAVACEGERCVWKIAHHLWRQRVLAAFKPPQLLSCDEAIAYLGISTSTWKATAARRWEILPVPVEGTHTDRSSKYRFSDVERLFEHRDLVFTRTAKKGFADPVVPGLEAFIAAEAKRIAEEIDNGFVFDVPEHLPQNATQLMAYSPMVAKVIRYRLKYGLPVEDAINDIWVKILNSNVVKKFTRSAAKRMPATLTTDDVLDYLGIDWPEWQEMLATHENPPNPVKGAATSPDAVYKTADIRAIDESGYFRARGVVRILPAACVGPGSFDRYLQQTIEHALKNIFRTLDRRFNKEDTLGEGACIQENRRVRRVDRDSFDTAWEHTLASEAVGADSLIDINRMYERHQLSQRA